MDGVKWQHPRFSGERFPERTLIGRIYRTDELEPGPDSLLSIEIDGIDECDLEKHDDPRSYHGLLLERDALKPFGLVRFEIKAKQFAKEAGVMPAPGSWFAITLARSPGAMGWPVDHAQLTEDGYTEGSSGFVESIEFLADDGDLPPRPLGASVPSRRRVRQIALNGGVFPSMAIARGVRRKAVWIASHPHHALVRDVGQAGFVSLQDRLGSCLVHFDAGWPVAFNGHTAPLASSLKPRAVPVILSHWDWDHLHGFYVFPQLQASPWFAPIQTLGPGASRVAAQLDAKKLLIGWPSPSRPISGLGFADAGGVFMPCGRIASCCGARANRNQTGLAMEVELTSGSVALMTGDADYDNATTVLGSGVYDALVVTHHGAAFSGGVPKPFRGQAAIVSYGNGNTYRHPHATMQSRHVGWTIERTADFGVAARGSRLIL